jgi:hypothetical protein
MDVEGSLQQYGACIGHQAGRSCQRVENQVASFHPQRIGCNGCNSVRTKPRLLYLLPRTSQALVQEKPRIIYPPLYLSPSTWTPQLQSTSTRRVRNRPSPLLGLSSIPSSLTRKYTLYTSVCPLELAPRQHQYTITAPIKRT